MKVFEGTFFWFCPFLDKKRQRFPLNLKKGIALPCVQNTYFLPLYSAVRQRRWEKTLHNNISLFLIKSGIPPKKFFDHRKPPPKYDILTYLRKPRKPLKQLSGFSQLSAKTFPKLFFGRFLS